MKKRKSSVKSKTDSKRRIKKKYITTFFIVFLLTVLTVILSFFYTLPDVSGLRSGIPKSTSLIDQRITENKKKGKNFVVRKKWVDFNKIPLLLKRSAIVSEDIDFYHHHGIDYYELKESIKKNLSSGKKSRGGSTITQQLAKNLYLTTKKSYIRKIREMFIAKRLEKVLSKKRILELYLNVIEFGNGIFGVETASEFFFKKPVDHLSSAEIIRLISVLPKPLRVTPLSNSKYLYWRANLILKRLKSKKYISPEIFKEVSKKFKGK